MTRIGRRAAGAALLWIVLLAAAAPPLDAQTRSAIPPELEGWRDWVLRGAEHRACPFIASQPASEAASYRCAWPGPLTLRLDARGGTFEQRWQVYAESWVTLPGSLEHWPRDVRIDGEPGAIVARGGQPSARLGPGTHLVTGRFVWSARPESLPVAAQTGLVALSVGGERIASPERPGGAVWLGKRSVSEQPEQLEIQVYRLIEDQVPVRLTTVLRLQVAGEAREELLARALPEGFVAVSISSPLPARLEADGRLRVQVRAGSWQLELVARGASVASSLARPASEGPWAREEIWSFAGDDRLRIAAAEGAEGIDPVQANVPDAWRGYPAFRMPAGSKLQIAERSRGLQNADDNRLTLTRDLWLDFDHGGFTAVDRLQGSLRRDWRLDMSAPFRLESARIGEQVLLVTRAGEARTGVELRTPRLDLTGVARIEQARGAMPATGWATRFEQVDARVHLPAGHRLLGVWGADHVVGSWWSQWGLWNLFGVFVVVVFASWVAGPGIAALALAALVLSYQEAPGYIWLWANVIAAIGLARAAPEGRFRRLAAGYRLASIVLLGIALLPLLWGQLRLALYPQLDARAPFEPRIQTDLRAAGEGAAQPLPAAAPPPMPEAPQEADYAERKDDGGRARRNVDETAASVSGGLNYEQVVQRYAPGTMLQTGPGVPSWRFNSYGFGWSGPVEPEESVRLFYVGPLVLGLWRITGAVLLAALFLALLRAGLEPRAALRPPPRSPAARESRAVATAAIALLAGAALAPPLEAADTPAPELLEQLRQRLLAPPACEPACAEVLEARVRATPERLEVTMQVSALAQLGIALPQAGDRWEIEELSVDGRSGLAIGREGDGSLWTPLAAGVHTLRLAGRVRAGAESVQLAFPQLPRSVIVEASGWEASGVTGGRLLAGSLELTRRRAAADAATRLDPGVEFPPFVRVVRQFDLGLDWSMTTSIERIAPERAAFTLEVPLVAGESVLTEGIEVREGRVLAGLGAGQTNLQWTSGLPRSDALELALPADVARTEVWRFRVDPQWHVEFEGLPGVVPADLERGEWIYEFHPRPGERLRLRILRPAAAPGRTLAIDAVTQRLVLGARSTTTDLALDYRSTQGGRHVVRLPEDARVTAVRIDGRTLAIRPEKGALSLSLLPGAHRVEIAWTRASGAELVSRAAPVDLGAPASNVRTTLELPPDRWPLGSWGAGVGPAVLYWGELLVFLATAWLLGRWRFSPLATHEWLLLGLGLSTLSWGVFALFAAWLFAMRWRERWPGDAVAWRFNAVQLALGLFSVIAIGTLVWSGIKGGLLSSPDMGVVGPGSGGNAFSWFLDRTGGALPTPAVLSVPIWVYKLLIFAWAIWIAFALRRWIVWAGRAWFSNGFWRGRVAPPPARPTPPPHAQRG